MADFGGESADSLFKCFNYVINEFIPGDKVDQQMVAVCCDGAPANLGRKSGVWRGINMIMKMIVIVNIFSNLIL